VRSRKARSAETGPSRSTTTYVHSRSPSRSRRRDALCPSATGLTSAAYIFRPIFEGRRCSARFGSARSKKGREQFRAEPSHVRRRARPAKVHEASVGVVIGRAQHARRTTGPEASTNRHGRPRPTVVEQIALHEPSASTLGGTRGRQPSLQTVRRRNSAESTLQR
jgi:hypothetical protein